MASGRGIWTTKVKSIQFPSEKVEKIIGNRKSKIYHLPGQAYYEKVKVKRAGYRKAKR